MLTKEQQRLAAQAIRDDEFNFRSPIPADPVGSDVERSSPRSDPQGDPCDSPQTSLETHRNAAARGPSDNGPRLPLDAQLENLRKHLRQAHELVGRELYAICEAKLARGLTVADKLTLQAALIRIGNEISEIAQMVDQCQLSITLTTPKP